MNLIEKLGIEKARAIVDGVLEGRDTYCLDAKDYFKQLPIMKRCSVCVDLDDLRTAIANHDLTVSNLSQNDKQIDLSIKKDIEDHCTDIANHISPLTKVIER